MYMNVMYMAAVVLSHYDAIQGPHTLHTGDLLRVGAPDPKMRGKGPGVQVPQLPKLPRSMNKLRFLGAEGI